MVGVLRYRSSRTRKKAAVTKHGSTRRRPWRTSSVVVEEELVVSTRSGKTLAAPIFTVPGIGLHGGKRERRSCVTSGTGNSVIGELRLHDGNVHGKTKNLASGATSRWETHRVVRNGKPPGTGIGKGFMTGNVHREPTGTYRETESGNRRGTRWNQPPGNCNTAGTEMEMGRERAAAAAAASRHSRGRTRQRDNS